MMTAQKSAAETGWMSSAETGQMSAVETGEMSAAETGQMSSAAAVANLSNGQSPAWPLEAATAADLA